MEKPIVKIFDPKKEITLTIDASECTVSAILSQEDHPIFYFPENKPKQKSIIQILKRKHWQLSGAQTKLSSFYQIESFC